MGSKKGRKEARGKTTDSFLWLLILSVAFLPAWWAALEPLGVLIAAVYALVLVTIIGD